MKLGGIIAIGAMACGVGLLMPDRDQKASVAAPGGTGATLAVDAPGEERADYLSGEMVLQRQGDGHFYASPAINAVPIDALVDTGASVVALTGADAEAIGLTWDPAQVAVIGHGASGPVEGVAVRLDSIELGGFEVHDVDAMIVPSGLHISLLGQSFLSRIPHVRISDGRMSLSDQ